MLNKEKLKDAIDAGVIDPVVHDRIIANSTTLAQRSKIPEGALLYTLKDYFDSGEIKRLLQTKEIEVSGSAGGFYLIGDNNPVKKFQAICGFLVRNFVDAVVLTSSEAIGSESELASQCGVLLIPDLYREVLGAGQTSWKSDNSKIVALIDNRRLKGKLTIMHVDSLMGVQETFGEAFTKLIIENYIKL